MFTLESDIGQQHSVYARLIISEVPAHLRRCVPYRRYRSVSGETNDVCASAVLATVTCQQGIARLSTVCPLSKPSV
jgi:hypothetical protein